MDNTPAPSTVSPEPTQHVAPANPAANKSKKPLILGVFGLVVFLVLAALLVAPSLAVASWKSQTLDSANKAVDELNATSRDISMYVSKLQPTTDDMDKLASLTERQIKALETAKAAVKPIGGVSIVDVTGEYKKAEKTRTDLIETYDKLLGMNRAELARVDAQRGYVKSLESINTSDDADIDAIVSGLKSSTDQYGKFAQSTDGLQADKDLYAALSKYVVALERLVGASKSGDEAGLDSAVATMQDIEAEVDEAVAKDNEEATKRQRSLDAAIEQLNKIGKELE